MKKFIKYIFIFVMTFAFFFVSACSLVDIRVEDVKASIKEVEGINLLHYEIKLSNGEKITKDQTLDGLNNQVVVDVDSATVSVIEEQGAKFYNVTITLTNGRIFESKLPYTESSVTEEVTIASSTSTFIEKDGKTYHRVTITLSNGEVVKKDEPLDLLSYYKGIEVASSTSKIVEKDGKEYLEITINLTNGKTVTHYEEVVNEEKLDTITTLEEALENTTTYVFSITSTEDGVSVEGIPGYCSNGVLRIDYSDYLGDTYIDYIDDVNGFYYADYFDHYYRVSCDSSHLIDFCYVDFFGIGRIDPKDFKNNSDGTYSAQGNINAIGKSLFYDYDSEDFKETFTDITIKIKDGKVYSIVAKSFYTSGGETSVVETEVALSGYSLVIENNLPNSILITDENYYDYFDEDGFELDDYTSDGDVVSFTIEEYAIENKLTNGTQYTELVYDGVTLNIESDGKNSGKYYENGQNWRLYSSENPLLIISGEAIISSIVIEYEAKNGGKLYFAYNECKSLEVVEVEDYYAVFTLGLDGQINITSVTVVFDRELELEKEYYTELYQGIPTVGNVNVLVIPVEFSDDKFTTSELETINIGFNGTEEETGWQSLKTYYQKSSFGKLNINGVILDTYTLDITSAEYQELYNKYMDNPLTTNPIDELLDNYFATHNVNLSDYDVNEDGLVDGIYVVYSCKYDADDDSAFWAWTEISYSEVNYSNSSDELYLGYYVWFGVDFFGDPVIYDFKNDNVTYINCNAQTLIHESGHMLGLDDYYDFNARLGPEGGLGGADMMDYNVGDHNAVSKIILGWISDETIQHASSSNTYTIGSQSLTGDCIIITKDGTNTLNQEYILIELYTLGEELSGLFDGEEGLPSMNAIRIYHVDGTKTDKFESTFPFEIFAYDNGETSHKFIKILEADGDNSIERTGFASDSDYYVQGSGLPSFRWYDKTDANFTLTIDAIDASAKTCKVTIAFGN